MGSRVRVPYAPPIGSLAQLNRAFDYGSKGYRFESYWDHKAPEIFLRGFFVRPARTYSKGCKSLNCPDSGKVTAKGKGVRRETESEGSQRQTSGLTDRNPI